MIRRIIKQTQNKSTKSCREIKDKKTTKPSVYIEEPRRLNIPLSIRLYSRPPTTIQTLQKPRWTLRSKPKPITQPTVKKRRLYQWYERKQALRKIRTNNQREKKRAEKELKEAEKRDNENQILKHFAEIEGRYNSNTSSDISDDKVVKKADKIRKETLKSKKCSKKSYVKPRAASRSVSVKGTTLENRYDDMSVRFVNCFYRFCCQLYCYLTCFLIIGFVVIVII